MLFNDPVNSEFRDDGFLFIRATVIDTTATREERLAETAISSVVFCWYNADFETENLFDQKGKGKKAKKKKKAKKDDITDKVRDRIKENNCIDVTPCDKKSKRCKSKSGKGGKENKSGQGGKGSNSDQKDREMKKNEKMKKKNEKMKKKSGKMKKN